MSPNAGGGGGVAGGVPAIENSCAHGVQINFGDLTPYLTYDLYVSTRDAKHLSTHYRYSTHAVYVRVLQPRKGQKLGP
jgi:hypothetical protein